MTASDARGEPGRGPGSWWTRFSGGRRTLVAAIIVLFVFVALDALSLAYAIAGLIVLGFVALIDRAPRGTVERPVAVVPLQARTVDPIIDALLAALPDPVLLTDRDGRVIALNAAAQVLAPGLRHGEPLSLALRVPEVLDALRQANASGEAQRVEFSERVPIDRWFMANVTPIGRAAVPGMLPGLVLISFQDLTPLRRVEEMRADFVANASHELRTPLASLSGFIDTLQGPARDDAAARERFVGIMKAQATRMARLIDDLLSLSRIELNVHVRPQTPIELVSILRQVADALQMLARDRGVSIGIDAPSGPLLVPGDRDELIRVFENLMENALKYGSAGKRVDIKVARAEAPDGSTDAVVSVRDYGPGIAAEHLPRLTERFYRIDVGQSRAEGGTGLGLALVKHILNRHRGRLAIESTLGSGATFTVRLPLAAAALSEVESAQPIRNMRQG